MPVRALLARAGIFALRQAAPGRDARAEMHRIMYKIQKNDLLELLRSEICVILYSVYIK